MGYICRFYLVLFDYYDLYIDEPVSLTTSPLPHDGTFQKVNATRDLEPRGLHQVPSQ